MLIEIHMIQNHGPANLNRDDLGAPKTCIFGGVTRARISSQCLKRSIRRSPEFAAALENDGGVRTRRLIEEIAKAAGNGQELSKDHCEDIRKVFKRGGVGMKDENTSKILFFLPQSAIDRMGKAVRDFGNNVIKLGSEFAKIIDESVNTPDIALCGRMTEFDAKGPFEALKGKFTVEAALSAAHAISTHAVVNEVDYFTAVDDIPGLDAGAGHANEAMFNSACFYKHFAIDWEQLVKNLNGNSELARKTVECFLQAATKATPSGKQHSFAAFNPPEGIMVEVKQINMPVSYANAFADPVPEKSSRGLIGESIARLGQYVHNLVDGYGIKAERFWFSPNGNRKFTCVVTEEKSEEKSEKKTEQPVPNVTVFANFNEFVEKVMEAVGKSPAGAAQ